MRPGWWLTVCIVVVCAGCIRGLLRDAAAERAERAAHYARQRRAELMLARYEAVVEP